MQQMYLIKIEPPRILSKKTCPYLYKKHLLVFIKKIIMTQNNKKNITNAT